MSSSILNFSYTHNKNLAGLLNVNITKTAFLTIGYTKNMAEESLSLGRLNVGFSPPFSTLFSDPFLEGLLFRPFRQNAPKWCQMVPKVTLLEVIFDDFPPLPANPENCVWTAPAWLRRMWALPGCSHFSVFFRWLLPNALLGAFFPHFWCILSFLVSILPPNGDPWA